MGEKMYDIAVNLIARCALAKGDQMRKIVTVPILVAMSLVLAALSVSQTVKAKIIPGGKIGMVLMHGKGGTTNRVDNLSYNLKSAGILVETPLMPWSEDRIYDKGYEESMAEIDTYVARLKTAGAKKIFIAGHSIGANAALGYAARREGLSGSILLAYGHVPGIAGLATKLWKSTEKARAMITAGKGEQKSTFNDYGGGNDTAYSSANDLFSWFDPQGPVIIVRNASNVKPNTPVLCVDGSKDRRQRCRLIMNRVPNNPQTRTVNVNADHMGTPDAATDTVLSWLRSLQGGTPPTVGEGVKMRMEWRSKEEQTKVKLSNLVENIDNNLVRFKASGNCMNRNGKDAARSHGNIADLARGVESDSPELALFLTGTLAEKHLALSEVALSMGCQKLADDQCQRAVKITSHPSHSALRKSAQQCLELAQTKRGG